MEKEALKILLTVVVIIVVTTPYINAQEFIRGDSNLDTKIDISDAIFILDYLFKDGNAPLCQDAADANDDGIIDISDVVKILLALFGGQGNTIPAPYPASGSDPTQDELNCEIACVDECFSLGALRECKVFGSQPCGNFDSDKCLEWGKCPIWIGTPTLFIHEHEHEDQILVSSGMTFPIGQIFEIELQAAGIENSIKNARVEISLDEEVVESIDLSCSLKENEDSSQEYYKCIANWDTKNVEIGKNLYKFNAFVEDNLGRVYSSLTDEYNIIFVSVDTSLCEELIPGHNDPEKNRANIVFVGFGYEGHSESPEEILRLISEHLIDLDGDNFGLFSVEPFKSNKEKFNFWYVNELGAIDICGDGGCNDFVLSASCLFNNKYVVHIVDKIFDSRSVGRIQFSADVYPSSLYEYYCGNDKLYRVRISCLNGCNQGDGICNPGGHILTDHLVSTRTLSCTDSDITPEFSDGINPFVRGKVTYKDIFVGEYSLTDSCREGVVITKSGLQIEPISSKAFVHEFGHLFAGLRDEYVKPHPGKDELATYANCYFGKRFNVQDCLENAPWKDLIGNGCGKDGIVDCTFRDEDYSLEVVCYEGCTFGPGSGMYRPTENSIMRYSGIDPFSFGEWNEKLLKDELDKFS